MMSNNKILTVSYGTFSCTLEGFEDSFGTMKAIAEYFRDLAADDRYFGAEPPQPDADMLARIAEREIARRVEAHSNATGIHLRAGDAVAALGAQAAAAAPVAAAPAPADMVETAPVEEIEALETTQAEEQAPQALDDKQDGIAEAVAEPEEVVAHEPPVTEETADAIAAEAVEEAPVQEVAEVALAQSHTETEPDTSIMHASIQYAMSGMHASVPAEVEEFEAQDEEVAESDTPDFEDMAALAEPEAAAPAPDSIAAKLQRIRDVVAKNQASPDGYSEDEHANDFMDSADADDSDLEEEEPETDLSAAFADLDISAIEDDVAEYEDEPEDVQVAADFSAYENADVTEDDEADADTTYAIHAALYAAHDEDATEAEEVETATEVETLSFDEDDEDDFAATLARLSETLEEDEAEAPVAEADEDDVPSAENAPSVEPVYLDESLMIDPENSAMFDEVAEAEEEGDIDEDLMDVARQADLHIDTSGEDVPADVAPRARLLKVKRDEVEAALHSGVLEEQGEDDDTDMESSLSDEDEADLMRDLAAVEAELDDEMAEETAEEEDHEEASAARLLEEFAGAEEEELDRLMAEADHHMEEPEGNSRREAFTHMRAAVAATKADDKLSDDEDGSNESDYRTDLAAAVKPRRPVAGQTTERPRDARPAPLKLVAEQRIDTPAASAGPVRPRRVSSADMHQGSADNDSFADYASAQGATQLPEILEAAASYLSFVEGRDQFSRPQLMTKVRQLQLDGFTREDGLRHFGKLLRSGKIEKLKAGRFTVSDGIGFRPDDQRAAG